ncbi:MAG: DNA mismatch repair protein MutS [Holosporales bacterium]|jgi:DNA mismatch repair protein MutS|nr:DNA mismatch repair protein MutS [Holosporales bacterium]
MSNDLLLFQDSSTDTPMMQQYFEVKSQYSDCLLLFRMGEFFELFFEDAKVASAALDIVLTHRGKHRGQDIPMCGIPAIHLDTYMQRLIKMGFRLAICDQLETPQEAKKRGSKAVVNRGVVRIATSGTITEDGLLQAKVNNFLISIMPCSSDAKVINIAESFGLGVIDISTGTFLVETVKKDDLLSELTRYIPSEVICPQSISDNPWLSEVMATIRVRITPIPDTKFAPITERSRLEKVFGVKTLDSFGQFSEAEISASGALIEYLTITQRSQFPRLSPPLKAHLDRMVQIDAATRKNLEILAPNQPGSASLVDCIDETAYAGGGRLLRSRLSSPIFDVQELNRRLDGVEFFVSSPDLAGSIRESLKVCPDVERALSRVLFMRASPKDLCSIKGALEIFNGFHKKLTEAVDVYEKDAGEVGDFVRSVPDISNIQEMLQQALVDIPPYLTKDGGFIRQGYNTELDELRSLKDESHKHIEKLKEKYVHMTGISSLKIRQNNIWGWYVEVPYTQKDYMPEDVFTHRQTLANAVRYVTTELAELQFKIEQSHEASIILELKIFDDIIRMIAERAEDLRKLAYTLAVLDLSSMTALVGKKKDYCRPVLTDDLSLYIKQGRHPVVEAVCRDNISGNSFVPNDCYFDDKTRVSLLTGPNMSGKSTYLRQNALIIIMAQAGLFVPAKQAHIGVVDKLFSRIGASDELARGRSTFMVEMIETSAILHQAGPRSFVILDEVGRGTSTFDGLSLAWAILEQIHNKNRCRALFATHYHELVNAAQHLSGVKCQTPKIQDWNGKIIFHHEILEGVASKSYGLHVAEMAGIPSEVIKRARDILSQIENDKSVSVSTEVSEPQDKDDQYNNSEIIGMLEMYDLNNLSPKQALDALYEVKNKLATK